MGAAVSAVATTVAEAISVIAPPVVGAIAGIGPPLVLALLQLADVFNRNPEQENLTVSAIKHGIQDRSIEQRLAGRITDVVEEWSYERPPPSPPLPSNFQRFQKMIGEYLQTSMTDGHKLSPTVWP